MKLRIFPFSKVFRFVSQWGQRQPKIFLVFDWKSKTKIENLLPLLLLHGESGERNWDEREKREKDEQFRG